MSSFVNRPLPPAQERINRQESIAHDIFGGPKAPEFQRDTVTIQQPWVAMPPNGEPFDLVEAIVAPDPAAVDTVVITFPVAPGWEGVIKGVGNLYQGAGYIEGVTGQIEWRIRVNNRFLRGYENIQTSLGSLAAQRPVEGGHRIYSQDLVEYLVRIPIGSPLATGGTNTCIAMLTGWVYPVKTSGRI